MFSNRTRMLCGALASLAIAFQPLTSAFASQPNAQIVTNQDYLRMNVSLIRDVDQITWLLASTDMSEDAAKAIQADVLKRNAGAHALPEMKLVSDELLIDGQATGIRITSWSPMNISFKGKIWSYSKEKTPDQNYFSLVDFIQPNAKTSAYDLFIPKAHADDSGLVDRKSTRYIGTGVGIFAGGYGALMIASAVLAAGVVTAPVTVPVLAATSGLIILGAAVGMIAGGAIGNKEGDALAIKFNRNRVKMTQNLLASEPIFHCPNDGSDKKTIELKSNPDFSKIEFVSIPFKESITAYDKAGKKLSKVAEVQFGAQFEHIQKLILDKCTSNAVAEKLTAQYSKTSVKFDRIRIKLTDNDFYKMDNRVSPQKARR
jgi:hypothetical protein